MTGRELTDKLFYIGMEKDARRLASETRWHMQKKSQL